MFRFPLLPLLLIVGLVHSARGAEAPLPPEMVVLRAQPAVSPAQRSVHAGARKANLSVRFEPLNPGLCKC